MVSSVCCVCTDAEVVFLERLALLESLVHDAAAGAAEDEQGQLWRLVDVADQHHSRHKGPNEEVDAVDEQDQEKKELF